MQFTTIEPGYTSLTLFDMLGRPIATPFSGDIKPGPHGATIAVHTLPAGTYVYELRTPTQVRRRMLEVAR